MSDPEKTDDVVLEVHDSQLGWDEFEDRAARRAA